MMIDVLTSILKNFTLFVYPVGFVISSVIAAKHILEEGDDILVSDVIYILAAGGCWPMILLEAVMLDKFKELVVWKRR